MWLEWLVPILMAIAITLVHFLGEKISEHMKRYHYELESFGAGLMVGIIFLELLPHIAVGSTHLNHYIYLVFLVGFTIIAVVEKIVYKKLQSPADANVPYATNDNIGVVDKEEEKDEEEKELRIEEVNDTCPPEEEVVLFEGIAFITHGLVIGLLITLIFETYSELAFIILIPFFFRAFTLALSSEHIMEQLTGKREKIVRILSLLTPTIGATLGAFLVLNKVLLYVVFAIVLGLILFIVVRDLIPLGKKGKPFIFVGGVLLVIVIFLVSQTTGLV